MEGQDGTGRRPLDAAADGPLLTLDVVRPRAEAGGQTQLAVQLTNPKQNLVESFRIDVVGLDAGWWQVHPPEVAVYPGEDASAVVVLTPPVNAPAPEEGLPFGVRATSSLDENRSVVEEGDLEIGRVLDLQATITPVTSRARWTGKHRLKFSNWGNAPLQLHLSASDKDDRLAFLVTPDVVAVPVGGTASARVRARARRPFLRGAPLNLPFQVIGEPSGRAPDAPRGQAGAGLPDPSRPVLDAALLQRPVLSRAVVVVAGLIVLALVGAFALIRQAGDVQGATEEDVAPEQPVGVSVEALTATLIRVSWPPSDRATSHIVEEVDAVSGGLKEPQAVPGAANLKDMTVEQPLTEACYQVKAVRGDLKGPESERLCATTPDDRLSAPTDVALGAGADGRFQVTWKGNDRDEHVVLLDNVPLQPNVPAGVFSLGVTVPAGRHCAAVLARRGESLSSPPSAEACAEGTAASPGPGSGQPQGPGTGPTSGGGGATPTPTGQATSSATSSGTTGSQWVAALGTYQEENQAEAAATALREVGVGARVVKASDLPQLPYGASTLVVAVDVADEAMGRAFCAAPPPQAPSPCEVVLAGT